ncbi:thiol peroxidase [Tindallia californiensis]|uniref:Thiol peroxidase (Atypical 2-Cys peroxiredoxin) n=1 Tax=Tindallia californiensis TaxID=159292 RepID=A0A1H3MSS6_9FIRM|nr:thiol peroxidase [Tindallia californiensis]SDY79520.1 thiol peroxidase (atypical 2-Cys peroxiredoxin) [Tindallia californiensis]
MEKRKGIVTMKGNPVTLVGNPLHKGQVAPDFTALNLDLSSFTLSENIGKKIVISVAPSLDTEICNLQTIYFNEEAAKLENTLLLSISMDLPFALKRYCAAKGIDNALVLSDHRDADFGLKYGFLMEEFRLLARGIVIIDEKGVLQYGQMVPEIAQEPDYDEALSFLKQM